VESGVSGLAPPREWDAVTTTGCDAAGDECVFVALDEVRTAGEQGSLEAVACARRALEGVIQPPYRAVAVRRAGNTWAVGAVAIEVAELPGMPGDELAFSVTPEGERELLVDGHRASADPALLERLAAGCFEAYVLRAERLAADTWEVTIDPL
jgi:hypothetical protein